MLDVSIIYGMHIADYTPDLGQWMLQCMLSTF